MKNSYKFFNNQGCKYFPCHSLPERYGKDDFNCLFCFCPLYFLGEKCGGHFSFDPEKGVKVCEDCNLPHVPEYYDTILAKLKEAIAQTGGLGKSSVGPIT
ncbi:MAG: cysteine-rich small domain-containing protein [Coriobacteriia bacterium]|nr:cysteine-rich small domain-containing protein [Coriobacteriia bacterium]